MTKQLLCVSASMLLFGVTAAHAQVTTASINGTITDQASKETLIGASVVARHLPTGTVYGAATNAKGNFMIQGLRPGGPYVIEVSYVGYQTVKLENISLSLGETETFNIKLRDDSQSLQDVVVTAKKTNSLNATRTGAASSFNRSAIDRTPTVDRSLFDIAKLSPQASISSNGAVSFAGSNNRYNSFQIDGAVSNDVFGLSSSGTNGGQAGATPISIEAIDALQVVIAPYDVRQSGFTGGGINAITKSGTNELKGSAYAFYKDQNFFGKTAGRENEGNRQKLTEQKEYTYGATLGGAIIKNKLFYFVNAEFSEETYPSRYLPGAGSDISLADAQSIEEKMIALTGHNSGGFGQTNIPRRSYKGLARIDWNINSAHRLSLRYSYLDASKYTFANGQRSLNFLSRGFTFKSKTHSFVGELNSRLSNSVSNEFRAGYTRIRDHREVAGETMPSIMIRHGYNDIYLGSEPNSVANFLNQDIFTLTNNLTWSKGNHTFTFGTHNELFTLTNLYMPNASGAYTYDSLEDFLSIGTTNAKNPGEYRYAYTNVPGQKRWAPTFSAAQLGLYVQDEWKATDRLRLTYGLRVDVPLFLDSPTANETYNASEIAKKYGANNTMPKSTPLISPRIGFRYDLDETKKHLIRGGVGIFTGRIPFVWISNSFGNTGVELSQIRLARQKDGSMSDPNFSFNVNPDAQYPFNPEAVAAGVKPALGKNGINLLKDDFKFPQTLRANLAFETMLPGDVKLTVEAIYNKSFNNIMYTNLNRELSGKTYKHGNMERPLYSVVDGTFGDIIYLSNTDKGHSYNFSAQLSKEFNFGLSASVAYTYGKSRGVIDGTSSTAYSNWQYAYTYAGQASEEMAYTTFDTRHRIVANLSYRVAYGKNFATTIGLIYNGQTGGRFSISYYNDINGDGANRNDLMYVPTKDEIATMTFKDFTSTDRVTKQKKVLVSAADMPRLFEEFISGEEQLAQYRGTYVPRNALVAPFVHKIDLHFAQDFYFNVGKRRHTIQLNADVMNFANLLNPNWGITRSVSFAVNPLTYDSKDGSFTFNPYKDGRKMWTMADIESRWRAQVGIKYIF